MTVQVVVRTLLLAFSGLWASAPQAADLSDDEAAQVIRTMLSPEYYTVAVGPFAVVDREKNPGKWREFEFSDQSITMEYLNSVAVPIAETGLTRLKMYEQPEEGREWEKATGVFRTFNRIDVPYLVYIGETQDLFDAMLKGEDYSNRDFVPMYDFTVTKILKNVAVTEGATEYRVVSLLAVGSATPIFTRIANAVGLPTHVKHKARVKLRHDEFNGGWTLEAIDQVIMTKEFSTNNVQ